jgi:uncharacterized protein (TIGR02996 family)
MSEEIGLLKALAERPGDEPTRLALADWLEERGDPRAEWVRDPDLFRWSGPTLRAPLPGLIGALGHKKTWEIVTRGLVKLGARGLPLLLDALRTGSEDARSHARVVLGMLGPVAAESLPQLQRQLTSKDPPTLRAAAEALERLGPAAAPALPRLLELLAHGNHEVRMAVVRAISAMKHLPASALPALKKVWDRRSDEDEEDYENQRQWQRALSDAFAALGPAALEVVPELLASRNGSALAGLGLDVVGPLLAEVTDHEDEEIGCAVEVLENLGAPVIPILLQTLAAPGSSRAAKVVAVRALGEARLRAQFGAQAPAVVEHLTAALKSIEYGVPLLAATALGEIGEAARCAIPALREALRHKDAGHAAATALAQLGAGGAGIDALEKETRHKNAERRRRAVESLRELASTSDEAMPLLLNALRDSDSHVRLSAAYALASTMKPHWTAAVAPLRKALRDKYHHVRRHSATALGRMGPGVEDVLPDLLSRMNDRAEEVRMAIVESVALIAPASPEVLAALRSALDDPSGTVRSYAVRALRACPALPDEVIGALADRCPRGTWNEAVEVCYLFQELPSMPDSVVPAIRRILREGDNNVRGRMADTLRQMAAPPAAAIPELLSALADDDYHVGTAAAGALGKMGSEGPKHLAAHLAVANEGARKRASCVLSYTAPLPAAILPALLAAAKSADDEMRRDMASALGNVERHPAKARAALVRLLADDSADVRFRALEGLGKFGAKARSALTDALRRLVDESSGCRVAAIEALGKMELPPETIVPHLRQALGDFHAHVRSTAALAVGAIGAPAREALRELRALRNDPEEHVRQCALAAIAKIEAGE